MNVRLKKWELSDKDRLAELCNRVDRSYLSDRIPNPYTPEDANWWLNMVQEREGKITEIPKTNTVFGIKKQTAKIGGLF